MRRIWSQLTLSCAGCAGFPVEGGTLLCSSCWRDVARFFRSENACTPLDFGEVWCGFTWSEKQGSLKGRLLHALKGQSCPRTWARLADEFWSVHFPCLSGRWLFVPVPSRRRIRHDHAAHWGKALSHRFRGHRVSLLLHEAGQTEQKRKGERERRQIQFRPQGPFVKDWVRVQQVKGYRVALVDDIVTSGATAQAAWTALGRPAQFSIFALSYRIRLRK